MQQLHCQFFLVYFMLSYFVKYNYVLFNVVVVIDNLT